MYSAIMLTYNPCTTKLREVLAQASAVFDTLFIYDNKSSNRENVQDVCKFFDNLTFIPSEENVGIAGLNQAANLAVSSGASHITILDQDSIVSSDIKYKFEAFFNRYPLGVCAPVHIDGNLGNQTCCSYNFQSLWFKKSTAISKSTTDKYVKTDFAIGSGMTFKVETWLLLNGINEEFFLDCADFDLCFRMKYLGIDLFLILDSIMQHEIGEKRVRVLGCFRVSMHSPFRHYLYFKSIFRLFRKNYTPFLFKFYYGWKILFQYLIYGYLVENSKEHRVLIHRAFLGR